MLRMGGLRAVALVQSRSSITEVSMFPTIVCAGGAAALLAAPFIALITGSYLLARQPQQLGRWAPWLAWCLFGQNRYVTIFGLMVLLLCLPYCEGPMCLTTPERPWIGIGLA